MDHIGFTVPNVTEAADFLIEMFDCVYDWEVKRDPRPNAGERGWASLFNIHPESYLPHVMMLKCGDYHLTQYIELFQWSSPDQVIPAGGWQKFSDMGHGYFSFTVKDIVKVLDHIKASKRWPGLKIIQDPPMQFPLRGEMCTSTFFISPWGQWVELTQWSISGPKGKVIKALAEGEQQQQQGSCAVTGADGCEEEPEVGSPVENLETPAFLVDMDAFEHNIKLMTSRMKDKNVEWRPPVKAHKSPALAKHLLAAGATGILVLTVREAEVFAAHGFDDIHVANIVVNTRKIHRLLVVAKSIKRLRMQVETQENVEAIAMRATNLGVTVELLVEVNIGHNRSGVLAHQAAALAKFIQEQPKGVKFVGIAGYEGHTPVLPPEQKTKETQVCHSKLADAKKNIEALGIKVEVVTGGGSCNYMDALANGVLTELQAGGGAIVENLYAHKANLADHGHKIGAYVLTEVVSVPQEKDRAMADAGFKTVGWHPFGGLPVVHGRDDVESFGLSAEHLKLKPKDGHEMTLKPGDRIWVIPGYVDAMGFLHKRIYGIRHGIVEHVWPVLAQ